MSLTPLLLNIKQKKNPGPPMLTEDGHLGGVVKKPDQCYNSCPLGSCGGGFCPDWVPANPKIGVLFPQPGKDDVVSRQPLSGGMGRFFWGLIGARAGLRKTDVLASHILRCRNGWKYPVGADVKRAESACRQWDRFGNSDGFPDPNLPSLVGWNPNLFIVTFDLSKAVLLGSFQALVFADVLKAVRFHYAGYRPLVLFGDEPLRLVAPWLHGSAKRWRGTWWEGKLEWAGTEVERPAGPSFGAAPPPTYRRADKTVVKKPKPAKKQVKQLDLF